MQIFLEDTKVYSIIRVEVKNMIAVKGNTTPINEGKIIENIRALGIDMIDEAQSGHPGIVLGAAPILYALYAHHLRIDPKNPQYFNRDRFVMSAGHGSALLYATLAMAGFDLEIEDLKAFRKLGSRTPGHPEVHVTPGVEASTGPLGQGVFEFAGKRIKFIVKGNILTVCDIQDKQT